MKVEDVLIGAAVVVLLIFVVVTVLVGIHDTVNNLDAVYLFAGR